MPISKGPSAVRAALVEAAADLFAAQGNPSIRAVASQAGVNHGLVHHYLGSKRGLRAAVLERVRAHIYSDLDLPADASPRQITMSALERTEGDPRFIKILARALLDGELPEQLQRNFPVVERMREAGGESLEARAALAEGLALSLGMSVFGPWLRAALDLDQAQLDAIRNAALERLLDAIDAQAPHAGASN